ncbi:MAG: MarP family serine protease [Actinomycetota bacterium]|jgi:S1-C subfamily serine protease|nr:MarP family serine protease [Actinomycetota bacterium]
MSGDWLDLVIVVLALLFAVRGYHHGLLVTVASVAGLVGGALLGAKLAPLVASRFSSEVTAGIVGVVVVVVVAVVLQELARAVAVRVRSHLGRGIVARAIGRLDALGGALASVAAMLFVVWVLALAVSELPATTLSSQVQDSVILHHVDEVMPPAVTTQFSGLLRLAESRTFPPIFSAFGVETVLPTPAPTPGAVPLSAVDAAAPSIVKIVAVEPECSQESEGTGFVIAPDHILTNAHVVAGARSVHIVQNGAGTAVEAPATVVLYDPHVDVAILYVPGLHLPALQFAPQPAPPGANAAVVGYPENGPFTVDPARIREEERVTGPDIYQDAQVTREIYAIRALVRPGNSGGPLLDPSGTVYGVTFAKEVGSVDTGFSLAASQVEPDAYAGAAATTAVSTQGCL